MFHRPQHGVTGAGAATSRIAPAAHSTVWDTHIPIQGGGGGWFDFPVPQLVVATTPETAVISANRWFRKAFGYSIEDMTDPQRALSSLFPDPEYRKKILGWWDILIRGERGGDRPRRCLLMTKSGASKETIVCPRRSFGMVSLNFIAPGWRGGSDGKDRTGDASGEIAELKGKLREQQRCLENTLNAMVDPHLLLKPVKSDGGEVQDFAVVHSNLAARRHLGAEDLALEGKLLSAITPPGQVRTIMAWGRDVLHTKEPLIINEHAHCSALYGDEARFDIRVVAVDGMLSWTWRDVTERHNAARRLLESEEKYRLIAQNSSDVVVLTGKDGKIKWVSPSVSKVLGWQIHDWVGRSMTEFSGEEESGAEREEPPRSTCPNPTAVEGGTAIVARSKILSKDGTIHWVEVHTGPYMDAGGKITGAVSSIRLIDSQIEVEEELLRRARTDELTRLFNRKEAIERLNHSGGKSHRTGGNLAVLFVDLDRFKSINDAHGHAAGDAVLQAIADRIRGALRTEDDIGARIGGDEMLVVLHGVHDLADATEVGEKLRRRIEEPIMVDGREIFATVSVGVAMASPDEKVDALIARADDAMYRAKAHGRNRVVTIS